MDRLIAEIHIDKAAGIHNRTEFAYDKELADYDYNADGTIHEEQRGPLYKRYWYDLDKNLTGIRIHSGEELLVDNQYLYDGNGNRTHKKQLGGETLYHYDPLNQVKKVEYPGYTEELFYDKAGNRTRRIAHGVEELYQYDPRNRLTAYTKNGVTTPFRYDNAGNLLADDKARYTYDAFNRTVKVKTFDGNVQVNRYDAEGLRHEMEENGNLVRFIFNPDREAVTEEDNTGLTRLIRATELIARSTDAVRTYYHYASDEMGSTTHIVDEAGNVQNRYEYDAWGNITAQEEAVPNRFKYTGQQLDPITQQYYLRARFYNPVIGRFTQEDTYRGDGLNLYAYCANNPVYYVDPTGHWCDTKQNVFEQLAKERGIDLNNIDYDTRIRLMAEAANIVKSQKKNKNYASASDSNPSSSSVPKPSAKNPTAECGIKCERGTLESGSESNQTKKADFIVTPEGVSISTKQDYNLVSTTKPTNEGGEYLQIHSSHTHGNLSNPHTHRPKVNIDPISGRSNSERLAYETTAEDINYMDQALRNGTLRMRSGKKDKGG